MASLYISYFGALDGECAALPLGAEVVTTSATSAPSTFAAAKFPKFAKVQSDTAHYVTRGSGTPVATAANGFYLAANEVMWLRLAEPTYKFAAITA